MRLRYEADAWKNRCGFENGELIELPRITGGIDWSKRMPIVYRNGNWLLVKIPGHTGWSGVGRTRYYPTVYMFVEIIHETDEQYELNFYDREEVADNNWRDIQKRMKAEIDEKN